jgi:Nucleotide modification associated domain 2
MTVYSYVVASDSGFAPNPFHGICTLACCKPKIRQAAEVGDLVIGMSSRSERFVYAMRVSKVVDFAAYWAGTSYRAKRPKISSPRREDRQGDNIYQPTAIDEFRQLPSRHSSKDKRRDLSSRRVLVAKHFAYFGGDGDRVPPSLGFLAVTRGHRCRFTPAQVARVEAWFAELPQGRQGLPTLWAKEDSDDVACPPCG